MRDTKLPAWHEPLPSSRFRLRTILVAELLLMAAILPFALGFDLQMVALNAVGLAAGCLLVRRVRLAHQAGQSRRRPRGNAS